MRLGIFQQKVNEIIKTEDTFLAGEMGHMVLQEKLLRESWNTTLSQHQTIDKHMIMNLTHITIGVITATTIAEILSIYSISIHNNTKYNISDIVTQINLRLNVTEMNTVKMPQL